MHGSKKVPYVIPAKARIQPFLLSYRGLTTASSLFIKVFSGCRDQVTA
ncbi:MULTISPECIES: hypothetical protein [unclassified Rickettsia]